MSGRGLARWFGYQPRARNRPDRPMLNRDILVIDDEPDIRNLVREILEDEGFNVSVAENATKARKSISLFRPDLILLDIWMPDVDGVTLLKEWKKNDNFSIPVIMMSGHGNVETAVEATRYGAYDFIEKPLTIARLLLTIKNALASAQMRWENLPPRHTTENKPTLIGKSETMLHLREQIAQMANHGAPVLIHGESGTDKELYARYLHGSGARRDKPFIPVNISTLGKDHAEEELFGLREGERIQTGWFDKALGGTLFLKGIGTLGARLQARLEDVLETRQFSHIGDSDTIDLDLRIIAATQFSIEELVEKGAFRYGLYCQLNILSLHIPPLREHYEDIPKLLQHYVNYFIETEAFPYRRFSVAAQNRLRGYHWPGNVRELKNLVRRLLISDTKEIIDVEEIETILDNDKEQRFPSVNGKFNLDLPLREARENFEKAYLQYQLEKANGNVSKAANATGIERTHLYRKLKTLGIDIK